MRSYASALSGLLAGVILFADSQPFLRGQSLPNTTPLTLESDLSAQMIEGIGRYLDRQLAASVERRADLWQRDFSSAANYRRSLQPNRDRLARILGVVNSRVPNPEMEPVATLTDGAKVAETDRFTAYAVRWPVLDGVGGEGLLLQPKGRVVARVVAIPDADQLPELIAGIPGAAPIEGYARRLAESGCQVIVPTLVDRSDTFSGSAAINRYTNQPHREWIYRQAFVMGRHIIGYEVEKIIAAVDWLDRQNRETSVAVGVVGWGEGGLLALYSAALDSRIAATLVAGYFRKRERLWEEPIYRNLFGLLREFGDAEVATLIAPRALVVDAAAPPDIKGPPPARAGRATTASPGALVQAGFGEIQAEVDRARKLAGPFGDFIQLTSHEHSRSERFSAASLSRFLRKLTPDVGELPPTGGVVANLRPEFRPEERQKRQVLELARYTQRLLQLSSSVRGEFLWAKAPVTTPSAWNEAMQPYREKLWQEVIGKLPPDDLPLRPRSRLLQEHATWTGHEVVLDVAQDIYAWGYLLLPKGMKSSEKRPVVVVQHGLNGSPADVVAEDQSTRAYGFYKAFGVRLAERGFIVFAPHNPYRGDLFRGLQRKANPLGLSLFSVILAQHERILEWLSARPDVDAERIGFYGLSYGGKTAMRVPALLPGYALSICSGDFNEWIWKNVTTDWSRSYMFTREYEMPDFNLGHTFGYAEMAALIAPRPFMVERGHDDGVGIDEWVAFEYAKVNRLYSKLKIPQRTELEYFDGPHTIHGVGTFEFLHRHLRWPEAGVAPP